MTAAFCQAGCSAGAAHKGETLRGKSARSLTAAVVSVRRWRRRGAPPIHLEGASHGVRPTCARLLLPCCVEAQQLGGSFSGAGRSAPAVCPRFPWTNSRVFEPRCPPRHLKPLSKRQRTFVPSHDRRPYTCALIPHPLIIPSLALPSRLLPGLCMCAPSLAPLPRPLLGARVLVQEGGSRQWPFCCSLPDTSLRGLFCTHFSPQSSPPPAPKGPSCSVCPPFSRGHVPVPNFQRRPRALPKRPARPVPGGLRKPWLLGGRTRPGFISRVFSSAAARDVCGSRPRCSCVCEDPRLQPVPHSRLLL